MAVDDALVAFIGPGLTRFPPLHQREPRQTTADPAWRGERSPLVPAEEEEPPPCDAGFAASPREMGRI